MTIRVRVTQEYVCTGQRIVKGVKELDLPIEPKDGMIISSGSINSRVRQIVYSAADKCVCLDTHDKHAGRRNPVDIGELLYSDQWHISPELQDQVLKRRADIEKEKKRVADFIKAKKAEKAKTAKKAEPLKPKPAPVSKKKKKKEKPAWDL